MIAGRTYISLRALLIKGVFIPPGAGVTCKYNVPDENDELLSVFEYKGQECSIRSIKHLFMEV